MKKHSTKHLFLGLIFVILPTIIVTYPLLKSLAEYYSLLFIPEQFLITIYAIGIVSAYLLHSSKIRFFLIFALLLYVVSYAYDAISRVSYAEFDAYYVANRFKISVSIFIMGWFSGFAISRWRYFLIFFSILLLAISVIVISAIEMSNVDEIITLIAPTVFYLFYVLFVKELLRSLGQQEKTNYLMVILRIAIFSLLVLFLFWGTTQLLQSKLDEIQNEITSTQGGGEDNKGKGKDEKKNNNNQNQDNNNNDGRNRFNLDDYTGLRDRLNQSEELLFCAYIDNFIEDGVPNPQYITLYHLNQYNPTLEQFEVDPDSIIRDLFLPDPTSIKQYFVLQNDSVLIYDRMELGIKDVKSTIYIADLNPEIFVAPSTAFACQPISVEKEFKDQYRFAYNVYSEVSSFNSAYFVYNTRNPSIMAYQEQRNETLRQARNYDDTEKEFMDYYTEIPEGQLYDQIQELSDSLTKDDETTMDKILSIRNYFLTKDDKGKQLYTYTLTPGKPTDPNIPNASMLGEFLFNTHKGYCTYFATSSLFLLRSQGIPTRVAVGFMTIDRSHKTPGWYWFYADQAHAWTQVYIPEFGWLDFDMTVSNEGAEQAPQPDGTPPTPPTEATFVSKGVILDIDTARKQMVLNVDGLIINEQGLLIDSTEYMDLEFDVTQAKVLAGEEIIPLHKVQIGDTAVMVSFDYQIGQIRKIRNNEKIGNYLKLLPDPIPIVEVHVPKIEEEQLGSDKNQEEETNITQTLIDGSVYLLVLLALAGFLLILAPIIYFLWLSKKAKDDTSTSIQAETHYRTAHFVLNQMGLPRGKQTPMSYARDQVDPKFGTQLEEFIRVYQKLKYSEEELTQEEITTIRAFPEDFTKKVLAQFSASERFFNFLKPNRWIHYLMNLNLNK